MTRQEMGMQLTTLQVAYPRFQAFSDEKQIIAAVNLWYSVFGKLDNDIFGKIIIDWIKENTIPPTICEIRSIVKKGYEAMAYSKQQHALEVKKQEVLTDGRNSKENTAT